ncbi:MAG: hypothetical protein WC606_02535 [Candidatus Absconditabacterales bacterium]
MANSDLQLLDTFGSTCLVKMNKSTYSILQKFFMSVKKNAKPDKILQSIQDAYNSPKTYTSLKGLFNDLKSKNGELVIAHS